MNDEKRQSSRRDFLKLAAAGAPAVAVATAAAPAIADTEEAPGEGLRLTEHAKRYYDSARF